MRVLQKLKSSIKIRRNGPRKSSHILNLIKDLYSKEALPSDTIKNIETAYNESSTTMENIHILTVLLDKDITLRDLESSRAEDTRIQKCL